MDDKLRTYKDFPEIWNDVDGKGDAYLVKLGEELIIDINEYECVSYHQFDEIFEAGLKAGFQICQERNGKKKKEAPKPNLAKDLPIPRKLTEEDLKRIDEEGTELAKAVQEGTKDLDYFTYPLTHGIRDPKPPDQ